MRGNIYLIGQRGCGKTRFGQQLAERLGRPFIDLDQRIADAVGQPIDAFLTTHGEVAFRDCERRCLEACIAMTDDAPHVRAVVAIGAGCPPEVLAQCSTPADHIVWLRRPSDGAPRPLDGRPRLRPHLSETDEWAVLWRERRPGYARMATVVWEVADDASATVAIAQLQLLLPGVAQGMRITAGPERLWRGRVPSAKSELLRALILAAQATHPIRIDGHSRCDDVRVLCTALRTLGVQIALADEETTVTPPAGGLATSGQSAVTTIDAGASAAVLRFLIPLLAKSQGTFIVRGTPRLHTRPIAPLVDAVRRLGGRIDYLEAPGYPPLQITGGGFGSIDPGIIAIDGQTSSQFASALLLSSIDLPHALRLAPTDTVSIPYLDMTRTMLSATGVQCGAFTVPARAHITAERIATESDADCAAVLLAFGAIGGAAVVENYPQSSRQAGCQFLTHLANMGVDVEEHGTSVRVRRTRLRPFTINCRDCPDLAPLLAVCATFANGTSRITGAPHLRLKESNRIDDLVTELQKIGGAIDAEDDGLVIGSLGDGSLAIGEQHMFNPHHDHRLAMCCSLLALHGRPVTIGDPGVVTKSFPEFWSCLAAAGCVIEPTYAR